MLTLADSGILSLRTFIRTNIDRLTTAPTLLPAMACNSEADVNTIRMPESSTEKSTLSYGIFLLLFNLPGEGECSTMVDKFVERLRLKTTPNMSGLKTKQNGPYVLSDYMSDPFTLFVTDVPNVDLTHELNATRLDGSNSRTQVKHVPSWLDGLRLAYSVLAGQTAPAPGNTHGWTPRMSMAAGGSVYDGTLFSPGSLGSLYSTVSNSVGDKDFYDFPFAIRTELSTSRVVVDAKSLWLLMLGMFTETGTILFERDALYGYHSVKLSLLGKTNSFIRYSVECNGYAPFNHAIYYGTTECNVSMSFDVSLARLAVRIDSGRIWYKYSTQADIDPFVWNGDYRQIVRKVATDRVGDMADDAFSNPRFSISYLSRALFHTQSMSTHKLLGEVSENFESLLESPGFLTEVLPFAATFVPDIRRGILGVEDLSLDATFLGKSPAPVGYISRLRTTLKLLAGGYLAYIFATRPTLKSAQDVLGNHINVLKSLNMAEGLRYHGESSDLEGEPTTFQAFLRSFRDVPVVYYDVRFRSQVYMNATADSIINTFIEILQPAMVAGVLPEPKIIWSLAKFSFVVDMFLPISNLIEHAQDFFSSFRMTRSTVGHSVHGIIWFADGITLDFYIRSDATSTYIDPPADSWLKPGGPQADALIALACVLML